MISDPDPAKAVFLEAVEQHAPDQWPSFLDRACAGRPDLRGQVEALLAAHREIGTVRPRGPAEDVSLGPVATLDVKLTSGHPGDVIGPYKLVEPIGEGGMGAVWMAQQSEPVRRLVALKLIKPGMDSKQVIARFEAERQALALMDHPNIARVLDGGTTDAGRPYFVMDLVKGVPITRYCDEQHLTPRQRLELFVPVCQAVQHAHQKGVIHRDLKPSNVLVAPYDGKPVVKVIDFGVAKAAGQPLTEQTLITGLGAVVGTPEYMSPEQAELNNADIDTRSDVYALGVLLYELLTGTTPLTKQRVKQAALLEVLRVIREEEPPRPSTRLSTTAELPSIAAVRGLEPAKLSKLIRGELDWIVMKALEKDRNRRYETANGFATDVLRYLADEPVQACPPSLSYRLRKAARRHKAALAIATVTALALLVSVAVLAVSNARVRSESAAKQQALNDKSAALAAATISAEDAKNKAVLAKAAQREAMNNLKEALAAVDRMLTRVGQERLADVPQMEPVRRELLLDALGFYQRFLENNGDDTELRFETAKANRRVGDIHDMFRDSGEAEKAYTRATALLQRLADSSPVTPAYRHELAVTWTRLSEVLRSVARLDEAHDLLLKAGELERALCDSEPANSNYREALGRGSKSLGWVMRHLGRHDESIEALRQAVSTLQGLVDEFPKNPEYRYDLAESSEYLATELRNFGRPDDLGEAEKFVRRAIDLYERLDQEFPSAFDYRTRLGSAQTGLGIILEMKGRPADAAERFREANAIFTRLAKEYPHARAYEADWGRTLERAAKLDEDRGDFAEARSHYEQAAGHLRRRLEGSPDYGHGRLDLARCLNELARNLFRLGKHAKAEEACREATRQVQELPADSTPALWAGREAIAAQDFLAEILAKSGQGDRVEQAYREAIQLCRTLAAEHPKHAADFRRELAKAYQKLGAWLKERGQLGEYLKALESLADEFPAQPEFRLKLSAEHHERADRLAKAKKLDEAEAEYRKALEAAEKATADCPRSAFAWQTVGHRTRLLGGFLMPLKRYADAEDVYTKGVQAFETARTLPGAAMADCLYFAADTRRGQADALLAQQRPKEAEELYRKAVAGFWTLPAEFLQNEGRRRLVNNDLGRLVQLLTSQQRRQEAVAVIEQAIEYYSRHSATMPAEAAFAQEITRLREKAAELRKTEPGPGPTEDGPKP